MTEVMLMADVKYLGKAGEIVKVAPGYARNMLLPQGLAAPVTEASKRRLAKLEAQRAAERKARKAAAEALAAKLTGLSVTVNAQTVDGTKLYGGVNATDILAAIEADRGTKFERSQLDLPDQLKEVGTYEAKIDLGEGVTVPFKVWIV
ncbi:MAG: 50S ribosomal protein L9, partial [bacterium]|nr:50S ribosomal protein L9 [bacterium]